MEIEVTEEFIQHRAEKAAMYNKRGRPQDKFLMDLDAEIFEWYMITHENWEEHDDWRVDAIQPCGDKIDVKFISKWYNINETKMHNIIQQRKILDGFVFMEWMDRPDRPLRAGDKVSVRKIGYIEYEELLDLIKVSRGQWGGFYADVRKALMVFDSDIDMHEL